MCMFFIVKELGKQITLLLPQRPNPPNADFFQVDVDAAGDITVTVNVVRHKKMWTAIFKIEIEK